MHVLLLMDCLETKWKLMKSFWIYIHLLIFLGGPIEGTIGVWTLIKDADVEKYLALASSTFFSAAWGLTISSPCNGVKATEEAVPLGVKESR